MLYICEDIKACSSKIVAFLDYLYQEYKYPLCSFFFSVLKQNLKNILTTNFSTCSFCVNERFAFISSLSTSLISTSKSPNFNATVIDMELHKKPRASFFQIFNLTCTFHLHLSWFALFSERTQDINEYKSFTSRLSVFQVFTLLYFFKLFSFLHRIQINLSRWSFLDKWILLTYLVK